ncbi:N-acetylmuramic acid 6-phosphate etherase [Mycoplasmatota bacterium]|nr:N-acetylmuramic acid 6-phosphate etherase [Mycoplasmatota bacterium]
MVDIRKITTEKRNKNTMELDAQDTYNLVKLLNEEDKTVPFAVEKALPQIAKVVDLINEKFINGGRLVYMGAGTSGRIGILDASECPPTYGTDPSMVVALIAGGKKAMTVAIEGAEDNEQLAAEDLKQIGLNPKDIIIGIAASGRTPYVIGGIKYAKSIGVTTSCITTSENSILASLVDCPIEVITGAEPVTGSTRMKSGTAQKLVCNMLTTAAMIKMGKVYENLMIDVQPTNKKLISRANMIVSEVTGISEEEAFEYIKRYNSVKKAIFSILTGVTEEESIDYYLSIEHGHLRKAITNFNQK